MKIPFVSAFVAYLLGGSNAIKYTEQKPNDLDTVKNTFDKIQEDNSLELSKLNVECVDVEGDFNIRSVKNTRDGSMAEASVSGGIDFSTIGLKDTKLSISNTVRHELTHAAIVSINQQYNSRKPESEEKVDAHTAALSSGDPDTLKSHYEKYRFYHAGLPYINHEEEALYREALANFHERLNSLEKLLVKSINSKTPLTPKVQAIVDKLSASAVESKFPYDPQILHLKVGEYSGVKISPHDSITKSFPVILTEKPKKILLPSGEMAVSLSIQYPDKSAHALAQIANYKTALQDRKELMIRNYGNEEILTAFGPEITDILVQEQIRTEVDVEQPAYMVQYLEPVVEDLSHKMMSYMKKRLQNCSDSVRKAEGVNLVQSRSAEHSRQEL